MHPNLGIKYKYKYSTFKYKYEYKYLESVLELYSSTSTSTKYYISASLMCDKEILQPCKCSARYTIMVHPNKHIKDWLRNLKNNNE